MANDEPRVIPKQSLNVLTIEFISFHYLSTLIPVCSNFEVALGNCSSSPFLIVLYIL